MHMLRFPHLPINTIICTLNIIPDSNQPGDNRFMTYLCMVVKYLIPVETADLALSCRCPEMEEVEILILSVDTLKLWDCC